MTTGPDRSDEPSHVRVPSEHLESMGAPGIAAAMERFTVVRAADLPGYEVFDVRGSTRRWQVFHTVFDFCVPNQSIQRGEQRWAYRGRTYEGCGSSTMIMEPGELHCTVKVARPADFLVLRADEATIRELTLELGHRPLHFRAGQVDDARAYHAILRSAREFVDGIAEPMRIASYMVEFLRRALEVGCERSLRLDPKPCKLAVELAREYIQAHFATRLTLGEVAAAAGRTQWHLARSFKRVLGVTIHDYVTLVRLARAQQFLRMGLAPSSAAADAGFADQAHLTRTLRRYLGTTPAQYRRGSVRRNLV